MCDSIACAYFAWLFGMHWRHAATFSALFEGLGAELPLPTRFVIGQRIWLFPVLFLLFAGIVIGKEWLVRNKRFSVMLTFLTTLIGQFIAGLLVEAYYLPLFNLINMLSG
jgi:type II secretory pathway component PulF